MRVPEPVRAAAVASWRLVLVVGLVVGLPVTLLVVAAPFDPATTWALGATAVLLPVSAFVHELGHASAHVLLAPDRSRAVVLGIGRWTGGSIVRWSLGSRRDALVAAAGPLAGFAMGLPVALAGGAFLVTFPFTVLFGLHLVSLGPRADDGRQLRAGGTP